MLKQAAERVSCMSSRGSVLSRIFVQEWELTERDRVRVGDTTIEYEVHRSKRRKKTLQITVADRVVRVAVPWITKTREVREFVREQAPWIFSRLAALAPPQGRQTGPERDSVRVGDTTIEYEVRRSRRRKKTVLVTVERGVVRVVVPSVAKSDAVRRAVRERAAWIISRLSQAPPKRNQTGHERDSIRVGDTTIEYEVLAVDDERRRSRSEWNAASFGLSCPRLRSPARFGGPFASGRLGSSAGCRRRRRRAFRSALSTASRCRTWAKTSASPSVSSTCARRRFDSTTDASGSRCLRISGGRDATRRCTAPSWRGTGSAPLCRSQSASTSGGQSSVVERKSRVLIRNQRRRWGSCASDGTLRINWRIIMLEPPLIEYIVVHELAHLSVRNHSPDFKKLMSSVLPDFRDRQKRLGQVEGILPL